MPILTYNLSWMIFNSILALVPVMLTVMLRQKHPKPLYFVFLLLWFLFLPNTIYLITDLQHMPAQILRSEMNIQTILIVQYITLTIFGILAYIFSLEPVSNFLKKRKLTVGQTDLFFIILNFIVAFGVILGKVQRTHSWFVFTDPVRVKDDILATIADPPLLGWAFFMGIIINAVYFAFRKYFLHHRVLRSKKSRK